MIANYSQVRVSRTDGRSWDTVEVSHGVTAATNARHAARQLTRSEATDYVEVILECREGAQTTASWTYTWTRKNGWSLN